MVCEEEGRNGDLVVEDSAGDGGGVEVSCAQCNELGVQEGRGATKLVLVEVG